MKTTGLLVSAILGAAMISHAQTPATAGRPTTAGTHAGAADIPDSEFVTVDRNGHLSLNGQRVRFWGHIGHFPNPVIKPGRNPRKDHELMVQRLVDLGFNMHRLWRIPDSDDFAKGDNSRNDLLDYGYFLLKQNDIKIWFACLNSLGVVDADKDVAVIDDPATAEEWKAAIRDMAKVHWWSDGRKVTAIRANIAAKWDPRLMALEMERMRAIATRVNKYTGLRYCDDPAIAIWELSNEEWWLPKMTAGQWMKLPKIFQRQLIEKWNQYLLVKYGTDDALRSAWKSLLPGESLAGKTVMLAPTASPAEPARLNDPNPHAQAALSEGMPGTVGREDFTHQRSADVIEFFMNMLLEGKAAQAKMIKGLGKSTRFSPLCWDTGTGWQIQCQYLHQHADAVTHCTYINGKHHDRTDEEFPFNSSLTEPPRMCWDKPWVEHNRAEGKPFFVYEIQIKNSTKYRSEFPMLVAALGAIQDWDIVNWHSYGPGPDSTQEKPHTRALEVGHSLDLHYGGDEVQLSAMRASAEIFKNSLVAPAPKPTKFVFGRKMLYHPDSMDYAGSYGEIGPAMLPTTYRHGCRLLIDPKLDDQPGHPLFEEKRAEQFGRAKDDEERKQQLAKVHRDFVRQGYMVIGPHYKPRVFEPNPVKPNDQITYDWRRGFLKLDSPGTAAFTGFLARLDKPELAFGNGVTLTDVKVVNPPDMPYPVRDDEQYVTFGLASTDGHPLDKCRRAILSLVSTSFNKGFELDVSGELKEFHGAQAAKGKWGTLPVLVARVGATVHCPAVDGMTYTFYDYEMNKIGTGKVANGQLRVPHDKPVFYVELERKD